MKKLLGKRLVVKESVPENRKEVVFDLTDMGRIALEGHETFSAQTFERIYALFDGMDGEEMRFLNDFLGELIAVVQEIDV